MLETDLSLKTEINLYYDLYVPEDRQGPAPLLVAVHGYGAHKRYMMREARIVAPDDFVVASLQAPYQHFRQTEGGYRAGFGWLTDYKPEESISIHHNFLLDVFEKLKSENVIDASRIYLYGFSQACALNFRFALTYPELLGGVIGVCGGIPSDLETNDVYKSLPADVFYLYSARDEFYPLDKYRAFEEQLKKRHDAVTAKVYDAKHEITDEMREDMKAWLERRN